MPLKYLSKSLLFKPNFLSWGIQREIKNHAAYQAPCRYRRVMWHVEISAHILDLLTCSWSVEKSLQISVLACGCTSLVVDLPAKGLSVILRCGLNSTTNSIFLIWMVELNNLKGLFQTKYSNDLWIVSSIQRGFQPCKQVPHMINYLHHGHCSYILLQTQSFAESHR